MHRDKAPTQFEAPAIAHIVCRSLPVPACGGADFEKAVNNPEVMKEFFRDADVQDTFNDAMDDITASGFCEGKDGCVTVVLKSVRGICRSLLMAAELAKTLDGGVKCYFINLDQERGLQEFQEECEALGMDIRPSGTSSGRGQGGRESRSSGTPSRMGHPGGRESRFSGTPSGRGFPGER